MEDNFLQIYSDESGIPDKRYQSIGLLSGFKEDFDLLRLEIDYVLQSYNRSELECKNIDGDSQKTKCAIDIIIKGLNFLNNHNMRIDILTWDTQDSRHSIEKRDDIENFKRMYYKSLVKCCERRDLSKFDFFPDEHSAINWDDEIKPILVNTNQYKKYFSLGSLLGEKKDLLKYLSVNIEEKKSHENVLIQFIDIITGLTRLSFESGSKIINRMIKEMGQASLLSNESGLSRGETAKFKVFKVFLQTCKNIQSGISFKTSSYLKTFDSSGKLNFRFYEPQHIKDKAPTKVKPPEMKSLF